MSPLPLSFLVLLGATAIAANAALFDRINGRLCISSQYTETHWEDSLAACAAVCGLKSNCQAFTMSDQMQLSTGDSLKQCRHFVFDKCSRGVASSCSYTSFGDVFVRRQAGLGAGQLCPSAYGNEYCGHKYIIEWILKRCDSDPGLVVMADIVDSGEMTHASALASKTSAVVVYLAGQQAPGSAEPDGGWWWSGSGCNSSVASNLWHKPGGEPDNGGSSGSTKDVLGIFYGQLGGLTDMPRDYGTSQPATMCKCLSPF